MPTATRQAAARPTLSRMSTARDGFTPALRSCGASMEAPAMPPKLEAGSSSLFFPSARKVPTNCSTDVLNHGREKNACGNFSSLSKHPFPIFNGEHPHTWKANCLSYFHVYNIHKCMWVIASAMHMEGKAKQWLQLYKMQHELGSWNQFMDAVVMTFGKHDHCQATIELSELSQRGEVNEGIFAQAEKITFHAPTDVVWDEEVEDMLDQHGLLKQLSLGGDNFVGDNMLSAKQKQVPIQASVACDGVVQEGFDDLPSKVVVWDEMVTDHVVHDGLLQQLAQGGEYSDADEWKPNAEFSYVSDASFLVEPNITSAVINDMHHKDIVWDDGLEQDHGAHGDLLQLLADVGEYPGEECPEQVVDEMPADFALHGGLLKRLASGMEYRYDKKTYQVVRLDTYQPSTKGASKWDSNISLLPISKWFDSFNDSESMELHMTRAQTGKLDSKVTYADHMAQELDAEGYQLSGYIFSDLMVLDRRQEAGNACKILREMQSWILDISSPWYQINSRAIYLVNMKHKESMSIRQWDPGITRLVMQGINCNSKCCTESYLWTGCYEVVCKEFLNTATAWGQAVFRGGGNVMTRIWPRGSSIVKPIRRPKSQPKSKPGADSMVYTRQLLTGRETSIRY